MEKVITRPKLDSKIKYALQDKQTKGWIAGTMPLSLSAKESDRKVFSGEYLNTTSFEWHYSHNAVPATEQKPAAVIPKRFHPKKPENKFKK
jgi:hypothetical protein